MGHGWCLGIVSWRCVCVSVCGVYVGMCGMCVCGLCQRGVCDVGSVWRLWNVPVSDVCISGARLSVCDVHV